jgi:hypothetical protein
MQFCTLVTRSTDAKGQALCDGLSFDDAPLTESVIAHSTNHHLQCHVFGSTRAGGPPLDAGRCMSHVSLRTPYHNHKRFIPD